MPSIFTDLIQELFWFFKNFFKRNINSVFVYDLATIYLSLYHHYQLIYQSTSLSISSHKYIFMTQELYKP